MKRHTCLLLLLTFNTNSGVFLSMVSIPLLQVGDAHS